MTSPADIVMWVPGTSNHIVNPYFAAAMKGRGHEAQLVDYYATWDFTSSLPNGINNLLKALVEANRKRKPGQRILVAGESQGALIISVLLAHPVYSKMIDRAVLLGHPGLAPVHFDGSSDRVLEINHSLDPATFSWDTNWPRGLDAVSRLVGRHDLSALPFFVGLLFRDPIHSLIAGWMALRKIPGLGWIAPDSHNYDGDMQAAAGWLLLRPREVEHAK